MVQCHVDLRDLMQHRLGHLVPLGHTAQSAVRGRIVDHGERLRGARVAKFHRRAVRPRRQQCAVVRPAVELRGRSPAHRTLRVQIPVDAMQTGLPRHPRHLAMFTARRAERRRHRHRLALVQPPVGAYDLAARIANDELPGLMLRVGEVVAECRAVVRVLSVIGAVAHPLGRGERPVPHRVHGLEQRQGRMGHVRIPLLERRQVIENPSAAAVGRDHQRIGAILQRQVVHRRIRQAEAELVPPTSGVPRHIQTVFQAGVVQVRIVRIAEHDVRIDVRRKIPADRAPVRTVIASAVQIRPEVAAEVPVDGDQRTARIRRRDVDRLDTAPRRQVRDVVRHVLPVLAPIPGHLHQPVVGTDPDHLGVRRGRNDGEDRIVVLRPRVVLNDRPARWPLLGAVVARQVGTDHLPGTTAIGAAKDHIATGVEHLRIVRGDRKGRLPGETIACPVGATPVVIARERLDVVQLLLGAVVNEIRPVLPFVVDQVRVIGGHHAVDAIIAVEPDPGPIGDAERVLARARTAPGVVVLQTAADLIEEPASGGDVVVLLERDVVQERPVLAVVERERHAAVVALDDAPAAARVDPDRVVVHVDPVRNALPGTPAVL